MKVEFEIEEILQKRVVIDVQDTDALKEVNKAADDIALLPEDLVSRTVIIVELYHQIW